MKFIGWILFLSLFLAGCGGLDGQGNAGTGSATATPGQAEVLATVTAPARTPTTLPSQTPTSQVVQALRHGARHLQHHDDFGEVVEIVGGKPGDWIDIEPSRTRWDRGRGRRGANARAIGGGHGHVDEFPGARA